MGLGSMMKKKVMAIHRQRATNRQYQMEKERQIQEKAKEAYYEEKQKVAIKDAQAKAQRGGIKKRLSTGVKQGLAGLKQHQKGMRKSNMGLGNVNMGGSGPNFGLSNPNAFDLKVNDKKKKGPFDL